MLSKWPIRNKLLFGIGLLLVIVATLSWGGFYGVYAYRSLVRNLSGRAIELPLTDAFSQQVVELRLTLGKIRGAAPSQAERDTLARQFAESMEEARETLETYREHLLHLDENSEESTINEHSAEWETIHKIDASLMRIVETSADPTWIAGMTRLAAMEDELETLQTLSWTLPDFLHERIQNLKDEVRDEYRALIALTWVTALSATLMLGWFIRLMIAWIFRPLRVLVKGSRIVAAGQFGYRIVLDTQDEMAELAEAMNAMTDRFETIRDGLDRQVQERTKQVVRSEQLASVGFLAAGVAHEINNPLASIALCAESLEGRIQELLDVAPAGSQADGEVIQHYLRMIQNEAFRCKGITERLLDFSRMGEVAKQNTDLRELIQAVIDMVGHLGRYQDKRLELAPGPTLIAPVNAQELKQVVLNLITNGLDSLSPGGLLLVELRERNHQAEIIFTDNGCGMTDEVLKHLFEPFFTRRRNGQGTGLGLSISYRIIADHGGQIDVQSDGPGKGSQFCVSLPLTEHHKENDHRHQAA